MVYRLVLRSQSGELRRALPLVTLDRYEITRQCKIIAGQETMHVGDFIVVEEVPVHSHKTTAAPPGPKRDRQVRRKLSWVMALFVTFTSVIAQIRGDPGRSILLGLAALCLIFCLSADRLAKAKRV